MKNKTGIQEIPTPPLPDLIVCYLYYLLYGLVGYRFQSKQARKTGRLDGDF